MNPATAPKSAAKGTEYRHAAALSSAHYGRLVRIEGDVQVYQLQQVRAMRTYIELEVTRSGRLVRMGVPGTRIIEVQP